MNTPNVIVRPLYILRVEDAADARCGFDAYFGDEESAREALGNVVAAHRLVETFAAAIGAEELPGEMLACYVGGEHCASLERRG